MGRNVDAAEIAHAAALLRAGKLVAFPTETVYGLGANALDSEAVARIYAVKRRPATSPLIVHVASVEMAKELVEAWPEIADRLVEKFWPGPLTLVLPAARVGRAPSPAPQLIPPIVTAGLTTVALRLPAHPVAQALLRVANLPIAAPSANRFTELSPTTAEHVCSSLGNEVDYILDGGACRVGIESTVVSLVGTREGAKPVLLRPGGISRRELEDVVGPVDSAPELTRALEGEARPSPGMHPRHYSPRTKLFLVTNGNVPEQGRGIYLQHIHRPSRADVTIRQMPQSAPDYAAALYETLHQADAADADWIAVDQPPDTPEWEAVQDRLRRAAACE